MVRHYYYLVAGLPDLLLDEGKILPDFVGFLSELSERVHPEDAKLMNILRLPYDNRNLMRAIENREEEFDQRGLYSEEDIAAEIKSPQKLPAYMKLFIEAFKENQRLFPGLIPEDQLTWLFYDEVTGHPNAFIRQWFTFELHLRNVLAGLNVRSYYQRREGGTAVKTMDQAIIGQNDVADLIRRSAAPDFSLGPMLPWIDKVTSLKDENPLEREKRIDDLRWSILDELTVFSYFRIETILAVSLKLAMAQRWKQLDREVGKERLDLLVKELTAGFRMPEA